MDQVQMKARTKAFANRCIAVCDILPPTRQGLRFADQLFRAGTAVGANYRAACRGRSKAEFLAKLGVVLEEADESQYWLELIADNRRAPADRVEPLMKEANELVSILVATINTCRGNRDT